MNANKLLTKELLRYAAASALALAVDAGLLFVLTQYAGVPYLWSGAAGFLAGLAVVYVLSIAWVFERRAASLATEVVLFFGIGLLGLGLNEGLLWLFTSVFGLYYLLSKALCVGFVFAWNFIARKYMLFEV